MKHHKIYGQNNMTEGPIIPQLLFFFFPILFGTFFQQLYNTADAMIVGNFVSVEALGAVGGTTSSIINFFIGIFVGLSSGFGVIIAQHFGAGQKKVLRECIHTAISFALFTGVIISIFGFFFSRTALSYMNVPETMFPLALSYMQLYFLGMLPNLVYNMGAAILRAVGDSRTPLLFLIISCFSNIGLDILFVIYLHMGVRGAAFATVISQIISALLILYVLSRSKTIPRLRLTCLHINPRELAKMLNIGSAAGMQSAMYTLANIIIQAAINTLGTTVIAAWTAYGKIDTLFWMTMQSLGIAITTFISQNFGFGNRQRVKAGMKAGLFLAVLATLIPMGILYFFGIIILRIFTNHQDVLAMGQSITHFLVLAYPAYILIEVCSDSLRGIGDSWIPMIMTASGVCILRIIWVIVSMHFFPSLFFILSAYPISWVVTSLLFIVYMFGFSKMRSWLNSPLGDPQKEA